MSNIEYESDGEEYNPKTHKKLLADVTSLQKSQFIKKAIRDEPALKRNEFGLVKPITDSETPFAKKGKVDVNELVNILDKTNKHLQLGKVLKKTADKKKVLPVPLEKPDAEKLQRAINYEKTKEKLEKWDAVVAKQRSSDHLVNICTHIVRNMFLTQNYIFSKHNIFIKTTLKFFY